MKLTLQTDNEFEPLPAAVRHFQPSCGIVLGSGLGALVESMDVSLAVPFDEVRGLPTSGVAGHAGRFAFGRIGATSVVIAQGRVHLYEGWTAAEVTAGVRFMAKLGIKHLILTNAAGTLNPAHAPGSWMMLADHLNLTGTSPLLGGPNFIDMSEVYSRALREKFAASACSAGIILHEGIYASLLGPQYETPAEVRMLRTLGADAVGMSTVLEAMQARALGIEVAGFSCLTNWAAGLNPGPLSHAEVMETGRSAADAMIQLLTAVLGEA